jgi:hypothetical protein
VGTSGQASSSRFNSTPDRGAFWELRAPGKGAGRSAESRQVSAQRLLPGSGLRRRRGVRPSELDPIALGASAWHPGGFSFDGSAPRSPRASFATYVHAPPTQTGASVDPADVWALVSLLARSRERGCPGVSPAFVRAGVCWSRNGRDRRVAASCSNRRTAAREPARAYG